ncbi:14.7 kDa ribonuclease H-like protein [bacterium HR34]|nr:14.7 kDa ribonuclease H-like protein [bacterium HR34]
MKNETPKKLIVYTDGSSLGNPGKSAIGFAIFDDKGNLIKEYSQEIGIKTNNEAEYEALLFALKKIKLLFGKDKIKNIEIEIRSDSQLMTSQLLGKYKILDEKIKNLFIEFWNLKTDFGKITITQIPREQNKLADALSKKLKQPNLF